MSFGRRIVFIAILGLVCSIPAFVDGKGFNRIAASSPGIAEIVFALGAGSSLVAVPSETHYPPEAAAIIKAGSTKSLNIKILLKTKPDLVFLLPRMNAMISELEKEGIMTFMVEDRTLAELRKSITTIGKLLNAQDRARKLVTDIDNGLEAFRVPRDDWSNRRVLVVIEREHGKLRDLYAAGSDSYYSEIIRLLGCKNACGMREGFRVLLSSFQGIVKSNPDVILELRPGATLLPEQRLEIVADWQQLKFLTAVMNGEVYVLNQDYLNTPGPRIVDLARLFKSILLIDK